ncbi:MAG: hypothetical protein ABEN55_10575, partial [Bradymonadaceae bacterium]
MFERMTSILAVGTIALLLAAGCGNVESSPRTWEIDSPECAGEGETCDPGDEPEEPDDPEDEPEEPDEPDDRPEEDEPEADPPEFCQPRAPRKSLDDLPEIPEKVRQTDCPDFQVTLDDGATEAEGKTIAWRRSGQTLRKQVRFGDSVRKEITFELADGEIRRVEKRENQSPFDGSTGERTTWQFDEKGRLLRKYRRTIPEGDGSEKPYLETTITQTWSGGHLVERTWKSRSEGHSFEGHWEWTYNDAGLMAHASFESGGIRRRTLWTYKNGQPLHAKRSIAGETTIEQHWSYRDDGTLEGREVRLQPLSKEIAESIQWNVDVSLDQYDNGPALGVTYGSSLSGPVDGNSEGCRRLPAARQFGYPTDQAAYQSVWHDGGQPRNVQRA